MLHKILTSAAKTAAALTVSTTAALMTAGMYETGSPWAPINAVSHIVDGDDVSRANDFDPRQSTIGLAVGAASMAGWAALYESALRISNQKSSPMTAIAAATAAYVIDYKLVPPRFTPGIEKKLSRGSIFAAYAVLAATLALSPLWNDYDDNRSAEPPVDR